MIDTVKTQNFLARQKYMVLTVVLDDGYARYRFTPSRMWINDESFIKREISFD